MADLTARLVYSEAGKAHPDEAQKAAEDLGFLVLATGRNGQHVQAEQTVYESVFSAALAEQGNAAYSFQKEPTFPVELAKYFERVYFPTAVEFF